MDKNSLGTFNVIVIAGIVLAILLIATMPYITSLFYEEGGEIVVVGEGEKQVAENKEEGTVVLEKEEGGIVTKKENTGQVVSGFVKFSSEEEYRKYVEDTDSGYIRTAGRGIPTTMMFEEMGVAESAPTLDMGVAETSKAAEPTRFSETNVQVSGIDEPDILKTDGKEIYFSPRRNYYYRGVIEDVIEVSPPIQPPLRALMPETSVGTGRSESSIYPPPGYRKALTHLVKAFPLEEFGADGSIDKAGNLLLKENILVIFEDRNIYGYNVRDPKNPKEAWKLSLGDENSIVDARLHRNTIYLITRTVANRYHPCPIPLFEIEGEAVSMRCEALYHPIAVIPNKINYHISAVDISSGKVKDKLSFVGSYDSTIYMSPNGVYVAYAYEGDAIKTYLGFLQENSDLFSKELVEKIAKLDGYDLSQSSKMNELVVLLSEYADSLSDDDELVLENEMENRMSDYMKKHKRDLIKTDIVKIGIDTLKVSAQGTIPGSLLNQFSIDEYKGNIRAATTIGGSRSFGWFGFFMVGGRSLEEENDVYVLDSALRKIGSIQGLGLTERIYSARFVEDKGYLVTFRQTDPFYVLDLSRPEKPELKGELKIPGYSSYLHPITKDKILGVGKEGSQVKVSLFDVRDPSFPKEADKFILKEYWSDILNTHHAFLLDDKYKIFFMPGGRGGYVFSYENDLLTMKKAVSGISAKRALFVDDNLYIAGEDKIIVLDENTWERVRELDLSI